MTKLADAFLQKRHCRTSYDAYVISRLTVPSPELTRHLSIEMLHRVAERIVYLDDLPSVFTQLEVNKQIEHMGMLRTVKLPFDSYWLEYRTTTPVPLAASVDQKWHWGALIEKKSDGVWLYIVNGIPHGDALRASLVYVVHCPAWPPIANDLGSPGVAFDLVFGHDMDRIEDDRNYEKQAAMGIYLVFIDLMFGSFLVTQPKVIEEVRVVPTRALQKARAAAGKPPLFEYRRLKVKIGDTRKTYSHEQRITMPRNADPTDSERAIQHRRYHKVMGHFRHYVRGDNPHTVWIEPHYRGDPAIGVTFTEREVSK